MASAGAVAKEAAPAPAEEARFADRALALGDAAATPAAPASRAAGPSMQRAEEVGLQAFLLPEDAAADGPVRARRGAPGPPGGDGFQLGLLDDLSRGDRSDVPRWARSETYFTFPRTAGPENR